MIKKPWLFGLFSLMLLFAVLLAAFPPEEHSFYPRCQFNEFTGLKCPGCGTTRAIHHLLHGELKTALTYNFFLILSLPVLFVFFYWQWKNPKAYPKPRWIYAYVIAMLLFGILRNVG